MAVLAGCGGGGGDGGRITTLEEDLAKVQADLEAAQKELATTKETLGTTQGELDETKETLGTTQGELATTKATLEEKEAELTTANTNLETTKDNLAAANADLKTARDDLKAEQAKLATAQENLTTATINLATTTFKLETAQADLKEAADDLETAETALAAEKAKSTTSQSDLATANADLKAAQDALTTAQGPDLKTAKADLKTAQDNLTAETAKLATANANLKTAQDALTTANANLKAEQAKVTTLQGQVTTLNNQVATLRSQLGQAQQGQQDAQKQAQTLEANQRAENLRKAFVKSPLVDDQNNLASPMGTLPVTITVPKRNQLTFKQGDRTVSTLSRSGLRGAKLTRTRGGTDTTVVYTDRELSRELVKHYGNTESTTNPGQFTLPATVFTAGSTGTDFVAQSKSTVPITTRVSLSRSTSKIPSSIPTSTETDRTKTETKASFSGTVHGVSGQFRCEATGGCMLTATGTYYNADDDNANKLQKVTLAVDNGTIYFKPNSNTATVSLCADTSQCLADDTEYMAFGWWREEPASALGDYDVGVFADVEGADAINAVLTGNDGVRYEYDGTAVGMYVEQGAIGTTGVTTRQGEFTASVRLDVIFTGTGAGIDGTIDGFNTTPTGGSTAPTTVNTWEVDLTNDGTVGSAATDGVATIDIPGTTSTGAWSHAFAGHHSTVAANSKPPAVTGTFNTRVPNLLHLVGAFGADLQ